MIGTNINLDNLGLYFSSKYVPVSTLDFFTWRIIAVPVFTAVDTLIVFSERFQEHYFMGATGLFLASVLGLERINMERLVFEYEFGSWNEIANANSVFFIDAFVNFGWFGVIFISIFVGQIFRLLFLSKDIAFKSLWLLLSLKLFSGSFLGLLFSNGFIYIIFHVLFLKLKTKRISLKGLPLKLNLSSLRENYN